MDPGFATRRGAAFMASLASAGTRQVRTNAAFENLSLNFGASDGDEKEKKKRSFVQLSNGQDLGYDIGLKVLDVSTDFRGP